MLNADGTEIKAVMWIVFVHFNLLQQRRTPHSEEFMKLYQNVVNPVPETSFDQRISAFKNQNCNKNTSSFVYLI